MEMTSNTNQSIPFTIAEERFFETMKPEFLYFDSKISLPKGDPVGYSSAIFLLQPSQEKSIELLNNEGMELAPGKYKWYYTDSVYKEKIGSKPLTELLRGELTDRFKENNQTKLKMLPYSNKEKILEPSPNVIIDLGQWMRYFFLYKKRLDLDEMCNAFYSFLIRHTELPNQDYKGYFLMDIHNWNDPPCGKLRFSKKEDLCNPLTYFLCIGKNNPESLDIFKEITLILIDSASNTEIIIPLTSFKKEKQKTLLQKLRRIQRFHIPESGEIEEEESESNDANLREVRRKQILLSVKNNLIGDNGSSEDESDSDIDALMKELSGDDILSDNYDGDPVLTEEEIQEEESKHRDDSDDNSDLDTDFEAKVNELIDQENNLLEDDPNIIAKRIAEYTKREQYIKKIKPEKTNEQKTMIEKLKKKVANNISRLPVSDLESKVIDEANFDEFTDTRNVALLKSKSSNFDKCYYEKKFEDDIDAIIRQLEKAEYPLYCIDKKKEDTSNQMNMKYTYTYALEDMNNIRHNIKVDIPIVIDNNSVFLKGSKKNIGHQLILTPLVKTGPDDVQLVCWYNKIFIHREKNITMESNAMKRLLAKDGGKYKVHLGNTILKNKKYVTPIDFDVLAKVYHDFTIGDFYFITDINEMYTYCKEHGAINLDGINLKDNEYLVVGFNQKPKQAMLLKVGEPFIEKLLPLLDADAINKLSKTKVTKNLMYATVTVNSVRIPAILFMFYCDGFEQAMTKAEIEWEFVSFEDAKNYHTYEYGDIQLADGYIIWKRNPVKNSLLLNGLQKIDMSGYSFKQLESKETFSGILSAFYNRANSSIYLDQFVDFMIDDRSKELLELHDLPTDLTELVSYGVSLLTSNSYKNENNMNNVRIRSLELIPCIFYQCVAHAYVKYRQTVYKAKPTKVSIKQDAVINTILSSTGTGVVDKGASIVVEEASSLNPILTLEKNRSVTFKGSRGINEERAMKLEKRGYDESMLGILAITTSNDSNVGIMRQMTLDPNIINTLGELAVVGEKKVDTLESAQLFSPAEMLTPLSVQHDDPDRTAMTYKQSKYMVMTDDADPVCIGNKVESIIPYHMSDEFSIMAKDGGKVLEYEKDQYMVVKYNNGLFRSIDLNPQVKKNAAAGFWITSRYITDLSVGKTFKKGQALAWDPKAFARNLDDRGLSMRLGVFCKVAVAPNWDIFEDSAPVTDSLSKRMATDQVDERKIALNKTSFIDWMVKIGDKVFAGDPLIRFDSSRDGDEELLNFLKNIKDSTKEEIVEKTKNTIRCKYSGEVIDIKVKSATPLEELDPSLQKIVNEYNERLIKKQNILDKYSNEGDTKFYKSGTLITDIPEVIKLDPSEKINGKTLKDGGIVISIYVKYKDYIKKGDKVCAEFALKGVSSHVIEKGFEPYSELHPEEEISHLIAPLAISARKVPSVFLAMYGNKCIVEAKRQHVAIWNGSKPIKEKKQLIMRSLINIMKLLDPSGTNADYYKHRLGDLSEKDFAAWFGTFAKDPKRNYYLEIIEFDRDLKIENIEKCAEYMGIPLNERIAIPYLNHNKETPVLSPEPVPVGYINMKRVQQTLIHKTHGSIKIDQRNGKTGQVFGDDKNARNSDVETYGLLALGAKEALKEFMTFRADDMVAKGEAYNKLSRDGYLVRNELTNDPRNRVSLATLDAYFLLQGIITNIRDKDRKPEDCMKIKLCTDKWIEENHLKRVTNQSYYAGGLGIPAEGGLLDPNIFGSTQHEQKNLIGYIDLRSKFFHPYILEILGRIFPKKIDRIINNEGSWKVVEGNLVEVPKDDEAIIDENTGVDWLVEHYHELELKKNSSRVRERRVDLLLESTDDEIFITKFPVIPLFYRDADTSKKPASIPIETKNYQKLLATANSIEDFDFLGFNKRAMSVIQNLLMGMRKSGGEKITHKTGMMHQSVMGKSIDYGNRAVISVPTMSYKKHWKDMDVDILHSGIPLASCLSTGYPLMIGEVMRFFNNIFHNNPKIPVVKRDPNGKYKILHIPTGKQLNIFTKEYIDSKMERYLTTFDNRFEPVTITLPSKEKISLSFTGRYYATDPNNPNASKIKTRALTWTDVFYICAMECLTDKHVYITRYPLIDYFGIFPTRCMPVSTVKTVPMEVNGKFYKHYPYIDPSLPKEEISTMFIDTIEMSNSFLDAIGGDYDGDTVTVKMVYSQEANQEAEEIINQVKQYLSTGGSGVRFIGNEVYLTYYNMTKYK